MKKLAARDQEALAQIALDLAERVHALTGASKPTPSTSPFSPPPPPGRGRSPRFAAVEAILIKHFDAALAEIRRHAEEQVLDHAPDNMVGPIEVDSTVRVMLAEMQTVSLVHLDRLRRTWRGVPSLGQVRRRVRDACFRLQIDAPEPNQAVDLVAAKKAMRELAKTSHPDVTRTHKTADRYREVIEAYGVLETYNKRLEDPCPSGEALDEVAT
jgi:hypothetical protein